MSADWLSKLEALYGEIERRFTLTAGDPRLAEAVQFRSNRRRPVHRWFHFKEGFSADLLSAIGLDQRPLEEDSAMFLDPFCGCGTTLLAGDLQRRWRARRIGVEINPFISFVAETKAGWRRYCPVRLSQLASDLLNTPLRGDLDAARWPALSTFHNQEMFLPTRVSALVDAVIRVRQIDAPERDLLLLGVASTAERTGLYRKDGRALRILRTTGEREERERVSVEMALRQAWSTFESDLLILESDRNAERGDCFVVQGDGRTLRDLDHLGVQSGQVSLIAYSPPYLNHIDYTEVYKVELWLLGFVSNRPEMLDLRKRTLRSHASVGILDEEAHCPKDVARALEQAASIVRTSGSRWHGRFYRLALAYLADIHRSIRRQHELLEPGGRAICVVGNSAHGARQQRIPIAVDLFIASIASSLGFEVEQLIVARQVRRRDHLNRFLRETVLILRKPAG